MYVFYGYIFVSMGGNLVVLFPSYLLFFLRRFLITPFSSLLSVFLH